METLDEYNKRRLGEFDAVQKAFNHCRKNNIACPKCGSELYDTRPFETLASLPPQKAVACGCGYTGYRVA